MDDDILSQGGGREPRPWVHRLVVAVALIAVVAGGLVYLGLTRHHAAPAAAHRVPATVSPASVPPPAASLPPEPSGITGQSLAWSPDVRLPTAGARPVWFSPASGGSQPIGGLPANRSGYQFTRVAGGWAVQAGVLGAPGECAGCAGPPATAWFLADGARSVAVTAPPA